jgi:hypothetical protein
VWCLVELATAVRFGKTTLMLVGSAHETMDLVDVREADATVEADIDMIFNTLLPQNLGQTRNEAMQTVNQSAIAACNGAGFESEFCGQAAMQAAVGNWRRCLLWWTALQQEGMLLSRPSQSRHGG